MNSRSGSIAARGWVALGFAFASLALPMVLDAAGLANYDLWALGDDPTRPADRGLGERICLAAENMVPACLLVWIAAQFRATYAPLFENGSKGGRIIPITCGTTGLGVLLTQWARWGPYTGRYFVPFQGWQFGVGWLLVWWCFVFIRFGAGKGEGDFAVGQCSLRE